MTIIYVATLCSNRYCGRIHQGQRDCQQQVFKYPSARGRVRDGIVVVVVVVLSKGTNLDERMEICPLCPRVGRVDGSKLSWGRQRVTNILGE